MPAAVSHSLEEDRRVFEPVDLVLLGLKPRLKSRHLPSSRRLQKVTQHANFLPLRVQAHESRVGAKHHILEALHRLDQMDFAACPLKGLANLLPLLASALFVDGSDFSRHEGILDV